MGRRLVYLSASTLPSADANAVHVAQMCDAFTGLGCELELLATRGTDSSVRAHYGLRHPFRIRFVSPMTRMLWMQGRNLVRPLARRSGTLYFGRHLAMLSRLAAWGYPVGVELHHPPRTERQSAALRRLIEAPTFLGLVVITNSLRGELLSRFPVLDRKKLLVAYDGVQADRIVEPPTRTCAPVRAVYCGSFHHGKGVEMLLLAAALVPEVAVDVIGGEPAQIDALRSQAPNHVRFLGALPYDECQRRLLDYDIALAPYGSVVRGVKTPQHESLAAWMSPLKIFEYMGAGLAIVTSDLPVLREVLRHGETAWMASPDAPAEHAAAIRTLAADAELRLRLARAAQDSLRSFTWENRAARILEFLETQRRAQG
ncbi:MAG: glycosyltransferase family 4 protein [Burkholderiaceae bacterium]|nr:glycosyltransferase family 4 protein [Burkholderiaceae bacterium]